jgi:soluble lytic murein transglycosylase
MMNWCVSSPVVMRQHLGPSSGRTVFAHVVGLLIAFVAPVLSAFTTLPWYQPAPRDTAEALLAKTLAEGGSGSARARIAALRAFSSAHPGTPVSGLAQIETARLLLGERKQEDAVAALRHPDVARTSLADYAAVALGQARLAAGDPGDAAEAFLAAADAQPHGPLACDALLSAGSAFLAANRAEAAQATLARTEGACPDQRSDVLAFQARALEARGDRAGAAAVLDRLDREYPASRAARDAAPRLEALTSLLPRQTSPQRALRQIEKADALIEADLSRDALAALRRVARSTLPQEEGDRFQVTLARALIATRRRREAAAELAKVAAGSPYEAQAAFLRARLRAAERDDASGYEDVASRFPGTPWAEQALMALARYYQKDAQNERALPYYQRLLAGFPESSWARQASWCVAWGDYRQGHFEAAAQAMERAARRWPSTRETSAFLYWAGRAWERAGQTERAAALYAEAARRFKHTYHGMRAADAAQRLPALPSAPLPSDAAEGGPPLWPAENDVSAPLWTRVRELVLLNRHEEAIAELRLQAASPTAQATIAWLEALRGRRRPAIIALKRACPWWLAAAGDSLPMEAWRLLYPLDFADVIETLSRARGLDPTLVAALICQESTYDADAISPSSAHGLMQIIPVTGRQIARERGLSFHTRALHEPTLNIDFGTYYLAQLLDRYGQRPERALAAYNAGPHRVDAWTAAEPDISAEDFIESIPFSETRHYVATVLANQAHYRRLYAFAASTPTARSASTP